MKILRIIAIIIIASGAFYLFSNDKNIFSFKEKIFEIKGALFNSSENIKEESRNFNPEPLINKNKLSLSDSLDVLEILTETNNEREKEGLPPLKMDEKLSRAASLKIDDMFLKGYFAHESPEGYGPADLVKSVSYKYLSVGENLALGGFKDGQDLVLAWMGSPGHRANILGKHFTEIGIAVKKGMYEGQMQWMAVQEFGTPESLCVRPETLLKQQTEEYTAELSKLKNTIDILKEKIENTSNKSSEYNELAKNYNDLVAEYNALVSVVESYLNKYNLQIRTFNECLNINTL